MPNSTSGRACSSELSHVTSNTSVSRCVFDLPKVSKPRNEESQKMFTILASNIEVPH